jgi:predicted NBD/HSP70 family sugar kinase
MPAILFDLGGTHLRAAVQSNCSEVHPHSLTQRRQWRIQNFLNSESSESIWDSLLDLASSYVDSVASIVSQDAPIILGFPGPVTTSGVILAAPTIAGNTSTIPDFRRVIADRTGRAVHILNEMSAAAWWMSTASTANRFLIVTVSSGIGSKVFDRSSTLGVLDDLPFAGEIGHVIVDHSSNAPYCDCGGRGHLGAIASGRGIERFGALEAQRDPNAFRSSLCSTRFGATPEDLRNEAHLAPAAQAGDPWARTVIAHCTAPLAQIVAGLTAAVGLDHVAIIGGFAQTLGDAYRQILEEQLAPYEFFPGFPKFSSGFIEVHRPENDVCLLGAATYAHLRLGIS